MSEQDFDQLRRAMVSNQLRPNLVTHVAVLAAMDTVQRENFIDEGLGALAYRDTIVPLGHGRSINPPIATGRLMDAANPKAGDRVLVVGAATGYVAACYAAIGCIVTALEEAPLIERARQTLAGVSGITLVEGELQDGAPDRAPFDIVHIDGAVDRVPEALVAQLVDDGRLVTALLDRGVSRLSVGRRVGASLGLRSFADVETTPLPGFAPAPAFTF